MNRLLLLLLPALMLGWSTDAGALENSYLKLMQTDIKADRGRVLAARMSLSAAEAEVFWPIHKDYQKEMDRLDQFRKELIQEYAAVGPAMSEEIASVMVQQFFELEQKELKIRIKCFEKLEKKISSSVAADFYRIDTQLNLMIHIQTVSRLRL